MSLKVMPMVKTPRVVRNLVPAKSLRPMLLGRLLFKAHIDDENKESYRVHFRIVHGANAAHNTARLLLTSRLHRSARTNGLFFP